jgi:two-component system, NtrC family, sensor kinase
MSAFMQLLRDIPLKRKLTVTNVLSSGVALLLACAAFVTHELVTFKDAMVADLSSAAAIIGHNSSAALAFGDPDSARRTLESFSTRPDVIGAALYDSDGRLFARFEREHGASWFHPPAAIEPIGYRFEGDRLKLFHAFELAGEPAGTVYIEAGIERLGSRMARYGVIAALVMLISSGVALLLSARLQRGISAPISDLAAAMNVVRTEHNYSVRASKQSNDELGSLIEGFNAMLDQIQAQDSALHDARNHLEQRVVERTHALELEITERELAQAEVEKIHRKLIDASRQAGMAEVATNVLHNVGNVLNSVNVSASILEERAEQSKVVNLSRLVAMLNENAADLGSFLTKNPRGIHIPTYLAKLSEHLSAERDVALRELESLRDKVDHIKGIVTMQQSYSKVSGLRELANVVDLMEDALRMNGSSLQRHGIEVTRNYIDVPALNTEKHKILQILVNLVRNAKDACKASTRNDKRISLSVANGDGQLKLSVGDNGVGIAPENMTRIFAHGFTTKKDGHGFGLHSGALAARELGGSLIAHSAGIDHGAVFTLELPLTAPEPEL